MIPSIAALGLATFNFNSDQTCGVLNNECDAQLKPDLLATRA